MNFSMPERPVVAAPTPTAPLTTVATLGYGHPDKIPRPFLNDITCFDLIDDWMYFKRFQITSADAIDKVLFKLVTNNWALDKASPWSKFHWMIAQEVSFSYELKFLFSKLPNCRLSFTCRTRYIHPGNTRKASDNPKVDIFEIDEDPSFVIPLDLFWNGVVPANALSSTTRKWRPYVNFDVLLRQKYLPTTMQPDTIDVLVFARLKSLNMNGVIVRIEDNTFLPYEK